MSKFEKESSLRTILLDAAKSGERFRFFGQGMMIVAEGRIAFVGTDVVGISHRDDDEADEYINLECIIKLQIIGEYGHY
jgi:hypothetical protein